MEEQLFATKLMYVAKENKCSDRNVKVLPPALLGDYDRPTPTDQPTDRPSDRPNNHQENIRAHREDTLPMRKQK